MMKAETSLCPPSRSAKGGVRSRVRVPDCASLCESARNTLRDLLVCIDDGVDRKDVMIPVSGEKEGRVAVLHRWITCLEKISDIERSLQSEAPHSRETAPLSQEDVEILERFLAGRKAEPARLP